MFLAHRFLFKFCKNWTKIPQSGYFDYQSTTPIDYRVMDAMLPFMYEHYGNPHSKTHQHGWDANHGVQAAREAIAEFIGANPREIIFTSGGTEANNMALLGAARHYGPKRTRILTTQIEHVSILHPCQELNHQGFPFTYIPIEQSGLINLPAFQELLNTSPETILCVAISIVNNEIGTIQNIKEIGRMCREKGVLLMVDGIQGVGKIPVDVDEMNIDLMSMAAHCMYGPKGVGALYVRQKPRVKLAPIVTGGGQERGLRSGTLAPFLTVGMGRACEVAHHEMEHDLAHIKTLYNKMLTYIQQNIEDVRINGCTESRYPGNLNLTFPFTDNEKLIMSLKQFSISSSCACRSEAFDGSYVLKAIGATEEDCLSSIRIGLGRYSTEEDVDRLLVMLEKSVRKLRNSQSKSQKSL